MSSNIATKEIYQRVMVRTGFYRDDVPTAGVTEAEVIRNNDRYLDKRIKYSVVIDTNEINATAIYELSGSPCIYFTQLNEPNPRELAKLHKLSWNHGLAPMLWVITPDQVLLYNCYSQPTEQDQNDPTRHLIESFETTESDLNRMNLFASRLQIESGEFWQWEKAKQVDRTRRVDSVLLEDLTQAEKKLTQEKGLSRGFAHTLLIRSIFIAYLQDRDILNATFLLNRFGVETFNQLLDDKDSSYQLFEWIQTIFNGDLFPVSKQEKYAVKQQHLEVIQSLIGGKQEIATGQSRLWSIYDFKVIPIELISSIYEKFIYATDAKSAKENSTHYTPINLVDLVLSEVFKGVNGDAKVLDLACGSGVFLVESLRRLVVKRWANGEPASRQMIRDTLYNQIYGLDINHKAVQIAVFSLYLTALELDYELDKTHQLTDDLRFQKLIDRNLFVSDVFNEIVPFNKIEVFSQKQFNIIVGNPPWKKSKLTKSATQYCKRKRSKSGYPNGYPTAKGTPPDQAFLWRIGDFANDKTRIGLILHGKPFFENSTLAQAAKQSLFMRFKPEVIINLCKLRNDKIFPKSVAPSLILIATGSHSQNQDSLYFVCPDRSLTFKQHGIIEIGSENIKRLSVYNAASDPYMLKIASWGSARDMTLIQKLRKSYPSLENLIISENWKAGQGFQRARGNTEAPQLYGKKLLQPKKMTPYKIDINNLGVVPQEMLFHRTRDISIYRGSLVITTRGLSKTSFAAAFCQGDVVYPESYYGISIPAKDELLAHFLNGVLNSALTKYFLFLTASVWGVERDEIRAEDLLILPVPPYDANSEACSDIISIENQLCQSKTINRTPELSQQLNEAVFKLYNLDETERILVQDTANLTIDLYINQEESDAFKQPQPSDLEVYALSFMSVIKPFFDTLKERSIAADIFDIANAPLQVVKFSIVPYPGRDEVVQTFHAEDLITVLQSIAKQLPPKLGDRVFTRRNLKVYVGENIYIIKPCQLRYWSRSAGFNDADSVLLENLRMN